MHELAHHEAYAELVAEPLCPDMAVPGGLLSDAPQQLGGLFATEM